MSETQSTAGREPLKQKLEQLMVEIVTLANQFKKTTFAVQHENRLLAASRTLLQLLAAEGPHSVPSIARRRSSTRQNTQILVNRLERMGCIRFKSNPAHKKSDLVEVTEKGRAILAASQASEEQVLTAVASHVSEPELNQTLELLAQIGDALRDLNGHPRESEEATAVPNKPERVPEPQPPDEDESEIPISLL
jgi:DNA-binding MarR family transcriptional regulator